MFYVNPFLNIIGFSTFEVTYVSGNKTIESKKVFAFRNIKTNITEEKNISSISFLQKIGKVYNIYDLYKEIYQDELISDEFGLNLPSSSSSTFK